MRTEQKRKKFRRLLRRRLHRDMSASYHVEATGLYACLRESLGGPMLVAVQGEDANQVAQAVGALTQVAGDLLCQDRSLKGKMSEMLALKDICLGAVHEMNRINDERAAKRDAKVAAENRKFMAEQRKLAKAGKVPMPFAFGDPLGVAVPEAVSTPKRRKK